MEFTEFQRVCSRRSCRRVMLKFIEKISFYFSSISPQSRSIRSFLYRINTDKERKENPKIIFSVENKELHANPRISLVYSDKSKLELQTAAVSCQEIYDDINRHARKLKLDHDIKSVS